MSIGLGPLQKYLSDPDIFEVMVVHGTEIWVEDREGLRHVDSLRSEQATDCIEHIARISGRRIDLMCPVLDARLDDGTRACVVIPPISVTGPSINLRKFPTRVLPLAAFGPQECSEIVRQLVAEKMNVVVSGETSSGKTSLLSSVAHIFTPQERIICVEDTSELCITHPHVVHLQTRIANSEGSGEITLQDLVRASLRMRPDRLLVGEVRGAEAIDMVLALTSGHRGCWSTVHATNASHTLTRVSHIIMRDAPQWSPAHVMDLVQQATDVVIHMVRSAHGRRRINEIVALHDGTPRHLYGPVYSEKIE
jgi:pilus assembly protein CpaF